MAKGFDIQTIAVIAIVVMMAMMMQKEPAAPSGGNGGGTSVDLCAVVEPELDFSGQRMFKVGTSITTEYARVLENGGDDRDLGYTSLNSGSLSVSPQKSYKIYYGENSTTYYTSKETVTGPCSDASTYKKGVLCTKDRTPTITAYDDNNNEITSKQNGQNISVDSEKDLVVNVEVSADECYGNPGSSKKNAICFKYNTTTILKVTSDAPVSPTPYYITNSNTTSGFAFSCYELPLLADNEDVDFEYTIETTSNAITAGAATAGVEDLTVYLNDAAFDLDADILEEIEGFEDEDKNELGVEYSTHKSIFLQKN